MPGRRIAIMSGGWCCRIPPKKRAVLCLRLHEGPGNPRIGTAVDRKTFRTGGQPRRVQMHSQIWNQPPPWSISSKRKPAPASSDVQLSTKHRIAPNTCTHTPGNAPHVAWSPWMAQSPRLPNQHHRCDCEYVRVTTCCSVQKPSGLQRRLENRQISRTNLDATARRDGRNYECHI